ncbi:MAG: ankyrin repeat domain-containing protein [Smithella sp.]
MKYRYSFYFFIISIMLMLSSCASTPLIDASASGNSLAVQKLIDAGANVNEPDSRGYTPLIYAVLSGNIETITMLLNKGANINAQDKQKGYTPLHWALNYENFDIVKLLIKKGADVNIKCNQGETAQDLILSYMQGDIIDEIGFNLWKPEKGKARLFFVGSELFDGIRVKVGNQTKRLNLYMTTGLAFIDVDSGMNDIYVYSHGIPSKPTVSVDTKEGQIYYFKVTQNMGKRMLHYALIKVNTVNVTPLAEAEAKKEIINFLKSTEQQSKIAVDKKPIAPKEVTIAPKVEQHTVPKEVAIAPKAEQPNAVINNTTENSVDSKNVSVPSKIEEPVVHKEVVAVIATPTTQEKSVPVINKQNETKSIPEEDVRNLVNIWLTSWQSGDMKTYRSCYAPEFKSKGMNLDAWVSNKVNVREKSKNISISIDDLQISVDGNNATAMFTQSYNSSISMSSGKKKLELRKINNEWKINREIM